MKDYPGLGRYAIYLCDSCIAGEGEECHTAGCALWLHSVDIPIAVEECGTCEKFEDALKREQASDLAALTGSEKGGG